MQKCTIPLSRKLQTNFITTENKYGSVDAHLWGRFIRTLKKFSDHIYILQSVSDVLHRHCLNAKTSNPLNAFLNLLDHEQSSREGGMVVVHFDIQGTKGKLNEFCGSE